MADFDDAIARWRRMDLRRQQGLDRSVQIALQKQGAPRRGAVARGGDYAVVVTQAHEHWREGVQDSAVPLGIDALDKRFDFPATRIALAVRCRAPPRKRRHFGGRGGHAVATGQGRLHRISMLCPLSVTGMDAIFADVD